MAKNINVLDLGHLWAVGKRVWSSEETSKPASWEVLHRWQRLKTEMRGWKEGSKRLERRSESKEKPRKKKLQ